MDQSLRGKTVALRTDVCGITVSSVVQPLAVHDPYRESTCPWSIQSPAGRHFFSESTAFCFIPFSLMRLYTSSSEARWLVCSLVCASYDPIYQQGLRIAPASFLPLQQPNLQAPTDQIRKPQSCWPTAAVPKVRSGWFAVLLFLSDSLEPITGQSLPPPSGFPLGREARHMSRPVPRDPHVFHRPETGPLLVPFLQSAQILRIGHVRDPIAGPVLGGFALDALLQRALGCTGRTAGTTLALDGGELVGVAVEISVYSKHRYWVSQALLLF